MALFRTRPEDTINPTIEAALSDSFSEHEMAALSKLGTLITIEAGARFATEGSIGQEAVVVLTGTADVIRHDDIIATVGSGTILGELALLTGEPRNASLVAHDELTISVMSRREFASLLDQCPRLALEVENLAAARLSA